MNWPALSPDLIPTEHLWDEIGRHIQRWAQQPRTVAELCNALEAEWYNMSRMYINRLITLTLKTPRKPASENVVCLCRLLNILANFSNLFCIQANSVDPDQTAPKGFAKNTLFAKSQADDKADDNCCEWCFKG